MASALITTRQTNSGPRYVVRFRLGGRSYPVVHGGSFKTMREAKARRDLIGGELAAGRNPADILRVMSAAPTPTTTLARARPLHSLADRRRRKYHEELHQHVEEGLRALRRSRPEQPHRG
jgi:hypothetical protein